MSTFTIKINTRSKKAKYLVGLISEMARLDKSIEIIEAPTPNATTRKAMREAENGKTSRVNSVDELFNSI